MPTQHGLSLTWQEVREEWLLAWPGGRKQTLFERSGPATFRFGRGLRRPNETIAKLTRPNSPFLSAAAQNNHRQLAPLHDWITRRLLTLSPDDEEARRRLTMEALADQREAVTDLLRLADLGIQGVAVEEEGGPPASEVRDAAQGGLGAGPGGSGAAHYPVGGRGRAPRLTFVHAASGSTEGARLDAGLHEVLQAAVVRIFDDPERNPRGALLVFTTHGAALIGDALRGGGEGGPLLRRDQVWLAEKDEGGASSLVPPTDFRVRKEDDLQRWYLRGRFGAVPLVDEARLPPSRGLGATGAPKRGG